MGTFSFLRLSSKSPILSHRKLGPTNGINGEKTEDPWKDPRQDQQDLVFSVELHLGLIPYPLSFDPYSLSLILFPYPFLLSLTPFSLSPSTVPFKKFRWRFLSFLLLLLLLLSQAKVKSTPNPWPKTWSLTKSDGWDKKQIHFWGIKQLYYTKRCRVIKLI